MTVNVPLKIAGNIYINRSYFDKPMKLLYYQVKFFYNYAVNQNDKCKNLVYMWFKSNPSDITASNFYLNYTPPPFKVGGTVWAQYNWNSVVLQIWTFWTKRSFKNNLRNLNLGDGVLDMPFICLKMFKYKYIVYFENYTGLHLLL